ncbi:hypothetical protein [Natrinema versiforme]|uniref:hypothetical protein n=1 Tax=Natrinema versiforme TaxID=88724 RepID=UPI0015869F96|nr:hypothetical protein [Natrinema versiforme]
MSDKMLRQDMESHHRVEKFRDIVEEQTGCRPTAKDAEARLTELGLKMYRDENMNTM